MESDYEESMDNEDEYRDSEIRNGSMTNEEELLDPEIGMEFEGVDAYQEYYFRYSNQKGFPMKIRGRENDEKGDVRFVMLSCSRDGMTKSKSRDIFKKYPVTKTGCKAKVRAVIQPDGKVQVTKVTIEHNHVLSPEKFRFYKKNRVMSKYVKRRLKLNDRAGIRPNKNYNAFVVEAGGHENVTFLQRDCYNYLDQVRRLRLGEGDAMALQNYFKKMQANNANFFYLIDLDDDERVRNVFWVDARSRVAYEEFGDAITFDTTYLTNKYDMPFAPFVGVNHHGQSTLFGCGLISSEDVKSFTWIFKAWLACMNDRAPAAIITDQDKAMKKAIEIVFPNTRHRWCLWHIMKKLPEKLSGYEEYDSIKYAMQKAVYDSLSCQEFEDQWIDFIDSFNIGDNGWLIELYKERSRWVPTFIKGISWAGMSSTQRSESMNAFFDGYVNSKTILKQFVEQYENALRSKVQKEKEEDFNPFNNWIPCITRYLWEKQFQDAYTTTKFKEVQEEIKGKFFCEISSENDCGHNCKVYHVTEDMFGPNPRLQSFMVSFNVEVCDINCNCQLFEFKGILCRHALTILFHRHVSTIPEKFILRRWRKDVKWRHSKVKIIYSVWALNPENERFDKMANAFYEATDLTTDSEHKTKGVMSWIKGLIHELKIDGETFGSNEPAHVEVGNQAHSDVNDDLLHEDNVIRSPLVVHRKGRLRCKRFQGSVEKIVSKFTEKDKGKKKVEIEKEKRQGKRKEKVNEKDKDINKDSEVGGVGTKDFVTPYYNFIGSQESHDVNFQAPSGYQYNSNYLLPNMGGFSYFRNNNDNFGGYGIPPYSQDQYNPFWSGFPNSNNGPYNNQ